MRDFNHSVNVLVKGYLDDTLKHGNCYACAVGNLICDSMGFEWEKTLNRGIYSVMWKNQVYPTSNMIILGVFTRILGWAAVFSTSLQELDDIDIDENGDYLVKKVQIIEMNNYEGKAKEQIDSTGYTVEELARIEYAFETASEEGDYMYNGLMAVVDVLADIHNVDLSSKEVSKELFKKELV